MYPGTSQNISERTEGSIFVTLHRVCGCFCAAKVAFSPTTPRLFSHQFLLGVTVSPYEPRGRRGTEVGALVTIKQCSAILVKTIFLIVTYSGDLVALPACLDHQKCMTQRTHGIWAYEHTLLKNVDAILSNLRQPVSRRK